MYNVIYMFMIICCLTSKLRGEWGIVITRVSLSIVQNDEKKSHTWKILKISKGLRLTIKENNTSWLEIMQQHLNEWGCPHWQSNYEKKGHKKKGIYKLEEVDAWWSRLQAKWSIWDWQRTNYNTIIIQSIHRHHRHIKTLCPH